MIKRNSKRKELLGAQDVQRSRGKDRWPGQNSCLESCYAPQGLKGCVRRFNAGNLRITTTRPAGRQKNGATIQYSTLVTTAVSRPCRANPFDWMFPALKRRAESCSPCGAKTIQVLILAQMWGALVSCSDRTLVTSVEVVPEG
jgi:hypothetical protein